MIRAVGSITMLPPLTATLVNKDPLAKEYWVSHQRRARQPSDPSHRRLRRQQSSLTETANSAVNNNDQRSDPSRRRLRQRRPWSTKTANATVNDNDWRPWLHPPPSPLTMTVVNEDRPHHHQRRQSTPMAPSHRLLRKGQPASTKTDLQTNAGSVPSPQGKATVITTM